MLGKIENGKYEALFCTWPCLALGAISGYKYALFICDFSTDCGCLKAFQAMVKTVHNWNFSKLMEICPIDDCSAVHVSRGLGKVEVLLRQTIMKRFQR